MPTDTHQAVLAFFYDLLCDYIRPRGVVRFASLRLCIREGKFRKPDLLLRDRSDPRRQDRFWLGADLVVEMISEDCPQRDLVAKRTDYAEASIPEYRIADPRNSTIRVLALENETYVEHGVFARGDTATSRLLDGLSVDAGAVFDAPERS